MTSTEPTSERRGSVLDMLRELLAARRNFDVWGISQRIQGVPAGACESGAADCSVMASWGIDQLLDDVRFARTRMEAERPHAKPVIGGLSLGSVAAIAAVNAEPNAFAGALLLEGTLYDGSPEVRRFGSQFCSQFEGALAAGVYYDGTGLAGLKLLNKLAASDPNSPSGKLAASDRNSPSPVPSIPSGLTNHQAWVFALSAPGATPTGPRSDFFLLAGDVQQNRLLYANEPLVQANIAGFNNYSTIRLARDLDCEIAAVAPYGGSSTSATSA